MRNEANRYLKRALANAAQFCDELVVLDDGSIDDTAHICRSYGAIVHEQVSNGWWGGGGAAQAAESSARAALWRLAVATGCDWVYVFDADHELLGLRPSEFKKLLAATIVNSWTCPLWDCWDSDELHRVDGFWQAWRSPRPWLARAVPTPNFEATWSGRGLHAGHFPANYPFVVGLMPPGAAIRHLGYVAEVDRKAKQTLYLRHAS